MDPSWCPACDRLILPKRFVIPVVQQPTQRPTTDDDSEQDKNVPPPPPAPTPVPSSPEVRKKPLRRHGGGLVHGTGRVLRNGGLKPLNQTKKPSPPPMAPVEAAPQPLPFKKTRVVISQEPTALYCSEECRIRDQKNSFLESEEAGFVGAPAAIKHISHLERVQEIVDRSMQNRRASSSSAEQPRISHSPIEMHEHETSSSPIHPPPVPPNSLVIVPKAFRTSSISSTSTASSSRITSLPKSDTVRPTSKSRPRLSSVPSWGSPAKAALAPPAHTHFTASCSSSSSLESNVSSIFEEPSLVKPYASAADGDETCGTTPSRRGSDTSSKKKGKRVSFASDEKPSSSTIRPRPWLPVQLPVDLKPSSLPANGGKSVRPKPVHSTSTPALHLRPTPPPVVDTPPPSNKYRVAMWPEDEKRTTESTRVHGELIKGYAKRFAPREVRNAPAPAWGRLWTAEPKARSGGSAASAEHERQPDSKRDYWAEFEEREAEARARRRAEKAEQRMEEERVICELLGGLGMREEDQPQARRMGRMAYDGMPGPAELRGLTYSFDQFLYPLVPAKPGEIKKKLFNFMED